MTASSQYNTRRWCGLVVNTLGPINTVVLRRARLVPGCLWTTKPSRLCNQQPTSTQPSIPPWQVNRVFTAFFIAQVKMFTGVHLCRVAGNTV